MSRLPIELHHEQEHPWSCVAACIRIIRGSWGERVDEATVLAELEDPKTGFDNAARIGKGFVWDPGDPRAIAQLRAELRHRWLIVAMYPGPLTEVTRRRRPVPVSRHGRLVPYEDLTHAFGLPHAIVLVEAMSPDGFAYLDPYYPRDGQPFTISEDEYVLAWTGQVVIPRAP